VAVAELHRAAELQYPASRVLPELARALLLQNQQKELIEKCARIDLADPAADADLKTSIATAYAHQGEVANARTALAAALNDIADYSAALKMESRLLAGERQCDAALAQVDKVIANDARDARDRTPAKGRRVSSASSGTSKRNWPSSREITSERMTSSSA